MEDEYFAAFGDDFNDDYDYFLSGLQSEPELDVPTTPTLSSPPLPRRPPSERTFRQTDVLREKIPSGALEPRILTVLGSMKREGLNLALFLDAIFWGDPVCTANRDIVYERTTFLDSPEFESVLGRLWSPPTRRAKSHEAALQVFVSNAMDETLRPRRRLVAHRQWTGSDIVPEVVTTVHSTVTDDK